jgi:hypothetical protein
MNRHPRHLIWLLLVIACSVNVYSQLPKGPTHLVLAVTYIQGRDPAFQAVPWTDPKNTGTWYAGYSPLDPTHPPAADAVVQAIRIVPQVEGDGVIVKVWTMYGERYFNKEQPVGTYHLSLDETVRIEELKQFGVKPFELRLIKVLPSTQNLPTFATNAPSISSLTIQPNDSTIASVTVKMRNVSYKDVIAIGVKIVSGDKLRLTSVPRGNEGRSLIEAGGTYDLFARISQIAQKDPRGFMPVSAPDQRIIVTSALFRDGTFEGDAEMASRAAGYNLGEKIMLEQLLPIFDQALAADESNTVQVLEQLRSRVESLTSDVDKKDAANLASKFPGLSTEVAKGLKDIIDIGSSGLKSDLLKSLDRGAHRPSDQTTTESFHSLLTRIRDGMKEWHDRL